MRAALEENLPASLKVREDRLSGDYEQDITTLIAAVAVERKRAGFFETQAKQLIDRLDSSKRRPGEVNDTIEELRQAMTRQEAVEAADDDVLIAAEARIANAESRISALLDDNEGDGPRPLLAERLSRDEQLARLKQTVLGVEAAVMGDWDGSRVELDRMRERLGEIAASVSQLVNSTDDSVPATDAEESLFERVQRFADTAPGSGERTVRDARQGNGRGGLRDRMTALRELQTRN